MRDCLAWINYCQTSTCMCFGGCQLLALLQKFVVLLYMAADCQPWPRTSSSTADVCNDVCGLLHCLGAGIVAPSTTLPNKSFPKDLHVLNWAMPTNGITANNIWCIYSTTVYIYIYHKHCLITSVVKHTCTCIAILRPLPYFTCNLKTFSCFTG